MRCLVTCSILCLVAAHCQGDIVVTAEETGGNVVFSGSGTADLSGLGPGANIGINRFVFSSEPEVLIGGDGVS